MELGYGETVCPQYVDCCNDDEYAKELSGEKGHIEIYKYEIDGGC